MLDQHGLVGARDVVDPDGLAESADDGLGQFPDVAVLVEGVLDLLVGDRRGVDADEALVRPYPGEHVLEDGGVEHHVAVEPQDPAGPARPERAQQALGGVRRLVVRVEGEQQVRSRPHDPLAAVAHDGGDGDVLAEGDAQSLELTGQDGVPVAESRERLGQGAAEAGAHAGREDHRLHAGMQRSGRRGAGQISRRARQGSVVGPHVHPLSWVACPAESPGGNSRSSTRSVACPSSRAQKVSRKRA